jgi:hypothetical protein
LLVEAGCRAIGLAGSLNAASAAMAQAACNASTISLDP